MGEGKWILTEDMEEAAVFVDLGKNSEAFTGYNGNLELYML